MKLLSFILLLCVCCFMSCDVYKMMFITNETENELTYKSYANSLRTLGKSDTESIVSVPWSHLPFGKFDEESESRKMAFCEKGLTLVMKGDTLYIPPKDYVQILDSLLLSEKPTNTLSVSEAWFYDMKSKLKE